MSTIQNPRYLRFDKARKGGRSMNFLTAAPEVGVSCYRGWMMDETLFMIDASELDPEQGIAGIITRAAADCPAFFLEGEEVGKGGDGEPLLKIENMCRVPQHVNLSATTTWAQEALKRWSAGPRTGINIRGELVRWRLVHGGWSPEVVFPEYLSPDNPSSRTTRRKQSRTGKKRERAARKKNRGKK